MRVHPHYDYVIAGAGAAGLSLLMRMIRSDGFSRKTILLADIQPKTRNDRTWCFWEKEEGFFEPVVCKKWDQLWYHGDHFSRLFSVAPYQYKMIRGLEFYQYCFDEIAQHGNITVEYGNITAMDSREGEAWLFLNDRKITAEFIFSSVAEKPVIKPGTHFLQQHFKGWMIQTGEPVFHPGQATLMDFRVPQHHGTTFVYVMPFAPDRALVEYTLFTAGLLKQEAYDLGLKGYIKDQLRCDSYSILESEFGVIPMTNHRFPPRHSNIIYLGTAGGQTKASSGYTFRFIQKHSEALVRALLDNTPLEAVPAPGWKYRFYDSVLLNVLATGKAAGAEVFTDLFSHNPTDRIFRFLDNESSLPDDVKLISTLPIWPFFRAGIQELV